jgi:hypothetical protein
MNDTPVKDLHTTNGDLGYMAFEESDVYRCSGTTHVRH